MTYLSNPTLANLIVELKARGHDYLTDTEAQGFLEQACADTVCEELWPFRLTLATAVANGSTPTNLGPVLGAWWGTTQLEELDDYADARGRFGDLTTAGTPTCFWVSDKIHFFPTGQTIEVEHYSIAAWSDGQAIAASSTAVTPVIPARHVDAIMLKAKAYAYEETDEDEAANRFLLRWNARIEMMRGQLIRDRVAGASFVKVSEPMV